MTKDGSRRIVHGLYSLGRLPAGNQYSGRLVAKLRRALESEVRRAKGGKLGIVDEATINRACRAEQTALLWQRWLRLEAEKLDVEQRLQITRRIELSTERRDAAIARLRLEGCAEPSVWEALQQARAEKAGGDDE